MNDFLKILDQKIEGLMKQFNNPSIAIGIIKSGEVIFSSAYGYSNIAEEKRVTENTCYDLASCSKAFTTFILGIAIDRGLIKLDDKIRTHFADFGMFDEYASENITFRDMAVHRSGLPRHDLVSYENNSISRSELVNKIKYLRPSSSFREKFQYQNQIYIALGFVLEKVFNKTWEQIVIDEIATPLQMTSIHFRGENMDDIDYCSPYLINNSKVIEIKRSLENGADNPCGGIKMSLKDFLKWDLMLINKGKYGDKTIISEETLSVLFNPEIFTGEENNLPGRSMNSYALGWGVLMHEGRKLVSHGGIVNGAQSFIGIIPEEKSGFVILTNCIGTPVMTALDYIITDAILGLEPRDYESILMKHFFEEKIKIDEANVNDKIELEMNENINISSYVGEYFDRGYGTIEIYTDEELLKMKLNNIKLDLCYENTDEYSAFFAAYGIRIRVKFVRDDKNVVNNINLEVIAGSIAKANFERT